MGIFARSAAHVALVKDSMVRPLRERILIEKGDILETRQENAEAKAKRQEAAKQFQTALAGGKESLATFISSLKTESDEDILAQITLAQRHGIDLNRLNIPKRFRKALNDAVAESETAS